LNRAGIKFNADDARLHQRVQFGAERDLASALDEVERLLAHAIAHDKHAPPPCIPKGEGVHAAQMVHALLAVILVEVQDRLAITLGGEAMTAGLERAAQLDEVVHLAVADQGERAILVVERLPACGEVDDTQTPHRQARVVETQRSLAIGAAVRQQIVEPRDALGLVIVDRRLADDAGDAAHAVG